MSTTPKGPMDELQKALEGLRKYVYDQLGIPTYVAERPDITTQKQYFMCQYPIDFEPPKIVEPDPWPLRNPALDRCVALHEYRDKLVYGRFCEGEKDLLRKATDGENSGQV